MNSNTKNQETKCMRLIYHVSGYGEPTVIYGLILEENDDFLIFKTARREYKINKKLILAIEPTNKKFVEEGEQI